MAWQPVETVPIDLGTGIEPGRAQAIAEALTQRVLPLLRLLDGRPEPLASAALFRADGRWLLLTCRHLFDAGAALGDLGVPLGASGRILWLRRAAPRVIEHPTRDLAFIVIGDAAAASVLARHWRPVRLAPEEVGAGGEVFVVAGYPYAQTRRQNAIVYARPVVLFTRAQHTGAEELRVAYARVARRLDGVDIYAPPLDGVSGATCWSVSASKDDRDACVLRPAGVQVAFTHSREIRAERLAAAREMFERLRCA
ncbi:MAG: hypothetical protein OHK0044_16450 [Burkholderiaceae bacterium]